MAVSYEDVVRAAERIKPYIYNTPLMLSEALSDAFDTNVYLKLDSLQKTGAFKVRGIFNKMLSSTAKKFVTASSGNHGLGLACASRTLGVDSTVVVPVYTPVKKVKAIQRYGAKVLLVGNNWNESYEEAVRISEKDGSVIVHPFEDADVVAGQGTLAVEIMDAMPCKPTHFLASIGGGSMIAGCSVVVKTRSPETRVLGLQTFQANAMHAGLQAGKPVLLDRVSTVVESFATKTVSTLTLSSVQKYVDDVILLDENVCKKAALFVLERCNLLVELSASINVAALQAKAFPYKKDDAIVIVICGGNYNLHDLIPDWDNQVS
jgi:threonine dehydratase